MVYYTRFRDLVSLTKRGVGTHVVVEPDVRTKAGKRIHNGTEDKEEDFYCGGGPSEGS